MNTQETKCMKNTHTTFGSTTNSNGRFMWKPLLYTVSVWTWQHLHLHTTHTHPHTHTILRWGHRLIHSRRNEWKWSGERDSIISLWWCSSPQRHWNENTALCPQRQTARSNHVPRKAHSLHDTGQSQLTVRAQWVYNDNMRLCLPSTSGNVLPVVICKCHSKRKCYNKIKLRSEH